MAVNSSGPQRSKENPAGTVLEYRGTLDHREEQSENTRGTAGMAVNSSGPQRSKRNPAGTVLEYRGTLDHREEQSENTRGTAGMAVNSSATQRKQEEPSRNSSRIPRNTRSQRRTIREHSRNGWNGCEQFSNTAEARGTQQEQFSNTGTLAHREEQSENTRG